MIEIRDLCKSYGDLKVYENFNLDLEEGKITCILGESGSGKTTLLNCVAGLTDFTGGVTTTSCSYIFQTPRLVPNLTVYGNLKLVCDDDNRITELLDRVHLTEKSFVYPKKLSGGQAQRVAIARAFLFGGQTLLMDEPFSSLDLKLKRDMIELFFGIWKTDRRTALLVTHDIDEALTIGHRVLVLRDGEIAADFDLSEDSPRPYGALQDVRLQLISALTDEVDFIHKKL